MKVVWTSDWSGRPIHTGYSRYSFQALRFLKERGHDVIEVGVGYDAYGDSTPWKTYPTNAYGGRAEGQDIAPIVATAHGADALVLFMDPPDTMWAVQYVDRNGNPLREDIIESLDSRRYALCMYSPIDGYCMDGKPPRAWNRILGSVFSFDAFAAPSRFGAGLLSSAVGRDAAWLPHGVDTSVFHPMVQKECRQRLGLPPDNFTIGYVGVNKRRKQLPALFETVAKLQALMPGTPITLVTHGSDRPENYDLQALADAYGVEANGASCYKTENLIDQGLVWLYNALDVMVLLSGGEGFGIPAIEAQACRVPALVTDYSAMPEVVPDAEMGWCKVPVKALIPQPINGIAWAWPDTDAAAERLAAFWKDKGLKVRLRKAAFEFATSNFDLPQVLPKLETFLQEAVERRRQHYARVRVEAVTL